MGMAAILVNGPRQFLQSFVSPPYGGSIWNLNKIGSEASEEKSFEILNNFPIQMYRAHTNAYGSELDLAVKRSNINVQKFF